MSWVASCRWVKSIPRRGRGSPVRAAAQARRRASRLRWRISSANDMERGGPVSSACAVCGAATDGTVVTTKSTSVKNAVSYFTSTFAVSGGRLCKALQHSRSPPDAGCGLAGSDLQEWHAEWAAAVPGAGFISPIAQ